MNRLRQLLTLLFALTACLGCSNRESAVTPTPLPAPTVMLLPAETAVPLTPENILAIIQPEGCADTAVITYQPDYAEPQLWLCNGTTATEIEEANLPNHPDYYLTEFSQISEDKLEAVFDFYHDPCCDRVIGNEIVALISGEVQAYEATASESGWTVQMEHIGNIDAEAVTSIELPNTDQDTVFNAYTHCQEMAYRCSDFSSATAAQTFFDACELVRRKPPYGLDANNNGIACELEDR